MLRWATMAVGVSIVALGAVALYRFWDAGAARHDNREVAQAYAHTLSPTSAVYRLSDQVWRVVLGGTDGKPRCYVLDLSLWPQNSRGLTPDVHCPTT